MVDAIVRASVKLIKIDGATFYSFSAANDALQLLGKAHVEIEWNDGAENETSLWEHDFQAPMPSDLGSYCKTFIDAGAHKSELHALAAASFLAFLKFEDEHDKHEPIN